MGKKIFVSYKYGDTDVKKITNKWYEEDKVRDYVDVLEKLIGNQNIYKGEHDDEDMSEFKDETIWTKLKDKIFDSSITIVLISKNMRELFTMEEEQWIPWEISYSLKEMTRNNGDKKSLSNGIICVVLPDKTGSYDYYINSKNLFIPYNFNVTFDIINRNMDNHKKNVSDDYIVTVKWDDFVDDINSYIDQAVKKQDTIDEYKICKTV